MTAARIARWMALSAVSCCALAAPAAADDLSFVKGTGTPFDTNSVANEAVVVDLDGDTAQDVVVPVFDDKIQVWWGRTDTSSGLDPGPVIATPADSSFTVEVANVDADTDLDLVAVGNQLQVVKQGPARTFTSFGSAIEPDAGSGPVVTGFNGIDSGNLDGDAATELAVTVVNATSGFEQGFMRILDNDGTGVFSFVDTYSNVADAWVGDVVIGRFNGSGGDADIAYRWTDFSSSGFGARLWTDDSAANIDYTEGGALDDFGDDFAYQAAMLDTADVDGDGFGDLLAPGSVEVGWGATTGTFTLQSIAAADTDVVLAAQMAGDAKLDLVGIGERLRVFTHGATPRTFTTGIDLVVPAEFNYAYGDSGDFDSDPRDDLVVGVDTFDEDFDDELWVLLTRDPIFPSPFPAPPDPGGNGNGDTDTGTGGTGGGSPTFPTVTPPDVTGPGPPGVPDVRGPIIPVRANQIALLPSAAAGRRRCGSRRNFRIRLRRPPEGITVVEARVLVNGKRVAVRRGARLTAPVDLRGFPRGRAVVTIRITLADGRVLRGRRVYRPCATKKRQGRFGRRRRRG